MCKPLLTFCILNAHLNVIQELDDTCLVKFSGLSSACWIRLVNGRQSSCSCFFLHSVLSAWFTSACKILSAAPLLAVNERPRAARGRLCVSTIKKQKNKNWTMTDTQQPDGPAWRAVLNSDKADWRVFQCFVEVWPLTLEEGHECYFASRVIAVTSMMTSAK